MSRRILRVLAAASLLAACDLHITPDYPAPRGAGRVASTAAMPEGVPLRIGAPALPGIDGPVPQTGVNVPALPFEAAPPVVRTTAEIMAARRPDGVHPEHRRGEAI